MLRLRGYIATHWAHLRVLLLSLAALACLAHLVRPAAAWKDWRLAGALHTFASHGRLGNKVFQNLAASLLAEKYNLVAHYAMGRECAELGLRLASGRGYMRGQAQSLRDADLRALLEAPATQLPGSFLVDQYYQTPWFARHLRHAVLPAMRQQLLAANPWRQRFGANSDTCVHARLGSTSADNKDDVDSIMPLPEYFFPSLVAAVGTPPGRVVIATDRPADKGVAELARRFSAELLDLSPVQTVQYLASCAHLVLSDGTFSWVIGALAWNATSVKYVPRQKAWHGDVYVFPDWEKVVVNGQHSRGGAPAP
jgi:hypothetical protein